MRPFLRVPPMRWAPRTEPRIVGTCVAVVAVGSALQVVLCAWGALWVELFLVLPSFLGTALAWYAMEHAFATEARLAERRVEFRIDVPERSTVVIQHRAEGPAMITTAGKGPLS